MRILFYTMNWYPFEGSIQPIYAAVLRSLQEAGHTVTILTSIPHRIPGRSEQWDQYRGAFFRRETWEGAEVVRVWTCSPAFLVRYKILVRMLSMVTFCLASLIVGLFLRKKCDIVLTVSHPPIAIGLNSRLIAMVKHCPFVYCLEDIYPDILIEARIIRRGLSFRLLRFLERWIYRKAGRVCVLSESMKANLVAKKIPADKIEIIPHFADTDRTKPLPRDNQLARQFGLDKVFVLLYPGSLSFRYGLEEVLAAAEQLRDHAGIRWVFIDRGQHRQDYRREIEERQIASAQILPFQPNETFPTLLASCDLGLVTLERGFGSYSVPSKLFNLMAAGRGIVAMVESEGEVARIIRQAECGVVVEPGDVPGLAAAVRRLASDPERCRAMGRNARRFLEAEFPAEVLCRRYHGVLRACIESST
jgi:colanic acid biosynthesis glycosyl transferase WcaI